MEEKEIDYEQHRADFLNYIANNRKELERCLKKNITYNEDFFNDIFNDTIVKCADYITRKKAYIKNFKDFFFICSKRNYIFEDNKRKKGVNDIKRDFFFNISHGVEKKENQNDVALYLESLEDDDSYNEKEERLNNISKLFNFISSRLEEVFGSAEASIYILYFKLKSENNRVSYSRLSEIMGTTVSRISGSISKMKKFVADDKEILEYKKKLGL